jgi:hypothetical protein
MEEGKLGEEQKKLSHKEIRMRWKTEGGNSKKEVEEGRK